MLGFASEFIADESGSSAIEYAMIGSGIFLAIFSVLIIVGAKLGEVFVSLNGYLG